MMTESLPVAVGDYGASVGTTGSDADLLDPRGIVLPPNGAFRAVKGVRFEEISDGLSNTLMVGEKHLPMGQDGNPPWDCGIYDGHNVPCSTRGAGPDFPLAMSPADARRQFGSRHPGQCQFVFCDGSVRPLTNTIDPAVLGLLANCNDGQVIPSY
jgi:prepilin-type processing-associated H-X9-DG protein